MLLAFYTSVGIELLKKKLITFKIKVFYIRYVVLL